MRHSLTVTSYGCLVLTYLREEENPKVTKIAIISTISLVLGTKSQYVIIQAYLTQTDGRNKSQYVVVLM